MGKKKKNCKKNKDLNLNLILTKEYLQSVIFIFNK